MRRLLRKELVEQIVENLNIVFVGGLFDEVAEQGQQGFGPERERIYKLDQHIRVVVLEADTHEFLDDSVLDIMVALITALQILPHVRNFGEHSEDVLIVFQLAYLSYQAVLYSR